MCIFKIFFFKAFLYIFVQSLFCAEDGISQAADEPFVVTIICGGSGARLWPVSREDEPKPLMRVSGEHSFLQQAFLRGVSLPNVSDVLTVTSKETFFRVKSDYDEASDLSQSLNQHFILEPCPRDTAAAIAAATLYVKERISERAILLILAADHNISKFEEFSRAVTQACELAKTEKLVTFGINPASPETGYGYIKFAGNNVLQFVEKPNLEKAKDYVDSGEYLWNSGMFCFRAQKMLEEMQRFCPDILEKTNAAFINADLVREARQAKLTFKQADFEQVRKLSIDYAVMEKSSTVSVVPCDIGWSDIGCWRSLSKLLPADERGNHLSGNVIARNIENCTVFSRNRVIGVIGLKGLAVIDTPDALLVVDKDSAQEVKHIVSTLKSENNPTYKTHQTTIRPWGSFTVLGEGPGFKVKSITVNPGGKLSLQSHEHRSEHWTVVTGIAKVLNGDQELTLEKDGYTFIPATYKHRLENIGLDGLTLIETQSGDYLGEDDIVRYDDIYGRA